MDQETSAKRLKLAQSFSSTSSTVQNMKNDQQPNISTIINYYDERTDEELLEWQEIVLSCSINENAINRVVENFTNLFEAGHQTNGAFEEFGISMAIRNHGLLTQNQDQPAQAIDPILIAIGNEPIIPTQPLSIVEILESSDDDVDNDDDNFNLAQSEEEVDNSNSATITGSQDTEHFDFMEAAVAVAIRKKGLTPCSNEMSTNR